MKMQKCLKYCPELNQITGSVTASLLMCQLEYWFTRSKKDGFYKFLEPCTHKAYKKGSSWVEEMGFSKAEFRSAFSRIGKVYKSKKAFLESKDPFEGKLYLSYYDRMKKLTYYVRNTTLVTTLLTNPLSASGYSRDLTTQSLTPQEQEKNKIDCIEVLTLFKTYCPTLGASTHLTPRCKQKLEALYHLLEQKGQDIRETLEQAFKEVERSDFLCGRLDSSPWVACLEWILAPQKFFKILSGGYRPFKRSTPFKPATPRNTPFHRMDLHHFDLELLEAKERTRLEANHLARLHNQYPPVL